jgi:hypothetical protein
MTSNYSEKMLVQTSDILTIKTDQIDSILLEIVSSIEAHNVLKYTQVDNNFELLMSKRNIVTQLSIGLSSLDNIYSFHLNNLDNKEIVQAGGNSIIEPNIMESTLKTMQERKLQRYWLQTNDKDGNRKLVYVRLVLDTNGFNSIGYAYITLDPEKFATIFEKIDNGSNSDIILINKYGNIISYDNGIKQDVLKDQKLMKLLLDSTKSSKSFIYNGHLVSY